MATRKQKVKVGLFLAICAGMMVTAFSVITGLYKEPGDAYWLEFNESILGLYEGGMVEYLGVPVGKVRDITVTTLQKAHVEIVINPRKVDLKRGVEGQLVLYSLAAGTMAISLSGGDPSGSSLPVNSQIPTKKSTIEAISSQITNIMENLASIAEKVNTQVAALNDDDIKKIIDSVKSILEKADNIAGKGTTLVDESTAAVKDVREEMKKIVDVVDARSKDLEKVAQELQKLLSTANAKLAEVEVPEMQETLRATLENISNLTKVVETSLAELNTVEKDVTHEADNLEYNLRSTMTDLRGTFSSLQILLEQLQQDPSQLVRGKAKILQLRKN